MKLGNRGWTVQKLVIYGSIIVLFLLISIFYINRLSGEFGNTFNNNRPNNNNNNQNINNNGNHGGSEPNPIRPTYEEMKNTLNNAARRYIEKYYDGDIGIDTIVINIANLVREGFAEQPKDTKDNQNCRGYVLVRNNAAGIMEANTFLRCSNYISEGYQGWRIGE